MAPISEWLVDETLLSSIFQLRHLPAATLALQQPAHCRCFLDVLGTFLKDQQVGLVLVTLDS